MSKRKTFRVLFAQTLLTEHTVKAIDTGHAENAAFAAHFRKRPDLLCNQWLQDGIKILGIEKVKS